MTVAFSVHTDLSGLGRLALKFPRLTQMEVKRALTEICLTLTRTIKAELPSASGYMRASVAWAVTLDAAAGLMEGRVFSQVPWAQPYEVGARPGKWPPRLELEEWAAIKARRHAFIRKMGVKQFAFVVARKIKRRGQAGHFVFRNTLRAAEGYIRGRLSAAVTRVTRRVNRG